MAQLPPSSTGASGRTPLAPMFPPNHRRRSRSESNYPETNQPGSRIHWTTAEGGMPAAQPPAGLASKQTTEKLLKKIEIENNIKKAAQAMLQAYNSGTHHDPLSKRQVELQVNDSIRNIANLQWQVDHLESLSSREKQLVQSATITPQATILSPVFSEPEPIPEEFDVAAFVADYDSQFTNISDQALLDSLEGLLRALLQGNQNGQLYRPDMLKCIIKCLAHNSWRIRAQCYRLMRHLEVNWDDLSSLDYLEFGIMRSLVYEDGVQMERDQALKFLWQMFRHYVTFRREGLVRLVIAVAEHADDKLRNITLLMLCELLIRFPELTIRSGVIKVLTAAANDGPWDISRMVVHALMFTLDRPVSRRFIIYGLDLETLVGGIHESYHRSTVHEDRAKISAGILAVVFNSWPGLHYLLSNHGRAFQTVTVALTTTPKPVQLTLLRMLYRVFGITKPRSTSHATLSDRSSRIWEGTAELDYLANGAVHSPVRHLTVPAGFNLSNVHRTLLLMLFADAGLLKNLVKLALDKDQEVSQLALYLVYSLLQAAAIPLPSPYVLKTQDIPATFQSAFDFDKGNERHEAADVLVALENYFCGRDHTVSRSTRSSRAPPSKLQLKMANLFKHRLMTQHDEMETKTLLAESQVLTEADYNSWNWDVIDELLTGPLTSRERLDDTLKTCLFFPILSNFFCPSKGPFHSLACSKANIRYVRAGCRMLDCLLVSNEGIHWLQECDLLRNVRDQLEASTPLSNVTITDNVFDKDKLRSTLSFGYFKFIQVLSKNPRGVRLLEHFSFYHLFYILAQMRSQDDVIKGMLSHMDYESNGHPRVILAQTMTTANNKLRSFATQFLGQVLAPSVPDFSTWGIQLLLFQLYDPAPEVQRLALSLLLRACQDPRNLASVVEARPNFEHFAEAWDSLKLLMVGTVEGLQYLSTLLRTDLGPGDLVDQLIEHWTTRGNEDYVTQLETDLAEYAAGEHLGLAETDFAYDVSHNQKHFSTSLPATDSEIDPAAAVVRSFHTAPHLLGQLACTESGRTILVECGLLDQLVATVTGFATPADAQPVPAATLLTLKAALWALGNVCLSDEGAVLVNERGAVQATVDLLATTAICNLRGTCLYVLAMMAVAPAARQTLTEAGWLPTSSPRGHSDRSYFVPPDIVAALTLTDWREPPPSATAETEFEAKSGTERMGSVSSPPERPTTATDGEADGDLPVPSGHGEELPKERDSEAEASGRPDQPEVKDTTVSTLEIVKSPARDDPLISALETEVIRSIGGLCTNVLQNAACKALISARTHHIDLFRSMKFCRRVLDFIGHLHFRFNARRFIIDLFSLDLAAHIPTFRTAPTPPGRMTLQLRKPRSKSPRLLPPPLASVGPMPSTDPPPLLARPATTELSAGMTSTVPLTMVAPIPRAPPPPPLQLQMAHLPIPPPKPVTPTTMVTPTYPAAPHQLPPSNSAAHLSSMGAHPGSSNSSSGSSSFTNANLGPAKANSMRRHSLLRYHVPPASSSRPRSSSASNMPPSGPKPSLTERATAAEIPRRSAITPPLPPSGSSHHVSQPHHRHPHSHPEPSSSSSPSMTVLAIPPRSPRRRPSAERTPTTPTSPLAVVHPSTGAALPNSPKRLPPTTHLPFGSGTSTFSLAREPSPSSDGLAPAVATLATTTTRSSPFTLPPHPTSRPRVDSVPTTLPSARFNRQRAGTDESAGSVLATSAPRNMAASGTIGTGTPANVTMTTGPTMTRMHRIHSQQLSTTSRTRAAVHLTDFHLPEDAAALDALAETLLSSYPTETTTTATSTPFATQSMANLRIGGSAGGVGGDLSEPPGSTSSPVSPLASLPLKQPAKEL
ncbi:hypothetical protein IWQ60_007733 [Tieghemiomyces parasiticus]|uniref:REM-1 domain-containing protein n=1 Tax=Tieghemiomyces parasiticus TaxID=78921 RepID=A0A9W8A3Q9_9FUNG|nr:hypothetical protein IWQ60_007733 [Tieghemiomyces parasiticus]